MAEVARHGDPGGQPPGAALGEGVEDRIDQLHRRTLVGAQARHGGVQGLIQVIDHRSHQGRLQPGG
ncbi:hypothetical protein D3C80_1915680 [compost metagenome]